MERRFTNQKDYSEQLNEMLDKCERLAAKFNIEKVEPIHLFYCFITEETAARNILVYMGINQQHLLEKTKRAILGTTASKSVNSSYSKAFTSLMDASYNAWVLQNKNALEREDSIGTATILTTMIQFPDKSMEPIVNEYGMTGVRATRAMVEMENDKVKVEDGVSLTKDSSGAPKKLSSKTDRKVNKYCIDLVAEARESQKDPVIGRDNEVREVIQILSRKSKNNPILIGDPGVGKSALVEGLAQRIARGDVPDSLKNKQLWLVDLMGMNSGTVLRGMFEERIHELIDEVVASNGEVILFIDEIHTILSTGTSIDDAAGAADALKPALARGQLHCIGATTLDEHRKYIEKDAALTRRFQKVLVNEPSKEDTVSILRGLKERFEVFHGVKIMDSALTSAVNLSSRYITDRFLPDKAIDLVDTACAMIKNELDTLPSEIDELKRRVMQLNMELTAIKKENDISSRGREAEIDKELETVKKKYDDGLERWRKEKESVEEISRLKAEIECTNGILEEATVSGDVERASKIKYETIPALEEKLEILESETANSGLIHEKVTDNEIAIVISRMTGIPLNKISQAEREKTLHLGDILHERVIGQDEAVEKITKAIKRSRAGIKDPKRPIGSFLFLGPTGVGKTELSKALAEALFDDEENILRLDMSEYMNPGSVNNLIGVAAGYSGHDEAGRLTEPVRRRPYSVILFDEVEKAHPDVFNILLQLFDDGRLTDNKSHVVDFKNTVIIMTSNLGAEHILDGVDENGNFTPGTVEKVNDSLRGFFKPEFLNRIDDIILFKPLTRQDITKIAKLMIAGLNKRLEDREISLKFSEEAFNECVTKGYEPAFGARPLRRFIQDNAETAVANLLLENEEGSVKDILIDLRNGEFIATRV